MPTLNSISANPSVLADSSGVSTITVNATADPGTPDQTFRVVGTVVGTSQQAEAVLTLKGAPGEAVRFTTDAATALEGDVLVTAPDGGTLEATDTPGVYLFRP